MEASTTRSTPTRREFDIDFLRGFVCLSLLLLHFYTSHLYDAYKRLFGGDGEYVVWTWRLGVESFFVLAGFMMAHMLRPVPGENVSIAGYLKRRFFRLIVPYWSAVLLFAAFRWAVRLAFRADSAPSLTDILSQMFLVQEFFVARDQLEKVIPVGYWSMVSLEQFYLLWLGVYALCLLPFGRAGGKEYGRAERVMASLTFLVCLASLALWVWTEGTLANGGLAWHMAHGTLEVRLMQIEAPLQLPLYSAFLALGMLLYWARRQNLFAGYFWVALLALVLAAAFTGHSRLCKAIVAVCIFLPLARGARVPDNRIFRFLAYCGKRSYSIYLIHPIAGIAFISLTWRLTVKSDWLAIPLTLIAVVVSLIASSIFYRFIEVPCQNKSRTVAYRRKTAAVSKPQAVNGYANPSSEPSGQVSLG